MCKPRWLRSSFLALRLGLFAIVAMCSAGARADEWRPLFDGSFKGWRHWLGIPHAKSDLVDLSRGADGKYHATVGWDRDPQNVVSVVTVDGQPAIRMSGETFGLLFLEKPLSNYHLRLEFRWGDKKWPPREQSPRDSGILYSIQGEPGRSWETWPASLELQLQERDCGDLYTLISKVDVRARKTPATNGKPGERFIYDPAGEVYTFEERPPVNNYCARGADFEKPNGEWNTVELVCLGEDSVHIVNGKVVMRLHGPRRIDGPKPQPVTSGPIILQSEGSELFYRAIEWRPITAIPAEFAEK